MYGLHNRLVKTLRLHSKLKYGKNSLFAHVLMDFAFKILSQVVDRVILQVDSTASAPPSFFCKNIIQVVNKLLPAILFDSIIYCEAVLIHWTDLGSILLENTPNFENWLTHFPIEVMIC